MDRDDYEDRTLLGWVAGAVVFALVIMFVFIRAGVAAPGPGAAPVTAAVTFGPEGWDARAQQVQLPTGEFHVLLTNNDLNQSYPWAKKAYDNQFACDQAIRGINDALAAIADPDPEHQPVVPELADHELVNDVVAVVNVIQLETHKRANLSISCSKVTAPSRGV